MTWSINNTPRAVHVSYFIDCFGPFFFFFLCPPGKSSLGPEPRWWTTTMPLTEVGNSKKSSLGRKAGRHIFNLVIVKVGGKACMSRSTVTVHSSRRAVTKCENAESRCGPDEPRAVFWLDTFFKALVSVHGNLFLLSF